MYKIFFTPFLRKKGIQRKLEIAGIMLLLLVSNFAGMSVGYQQSGRNYSTQQVYSPTELWNYTCGDYINDIAVSEDGNYIAVASGDGNLYFFKQDGTLLWTKNFKEEAVSVDLSKDGTYIFVANGTMVHLYNTQGDELGSFNTTYYIRSVDITPDGKYAVSFGKYIYFFNLTGGSMPSLYQWYANCYSANGKITDEGNYIVAYSNYGIVPEVYLYEGKSYKPNDPANDTNTPLWSFSFNNGDTINDVDISQDGEYIAVGTYNEGAYLLNNDGTIRWKYTMGNDVYSVSLSYDSQYVALVVDEHLYVFQTNSGMLVWKDYDELYYYAVFAREKNVIIGIGKAYWNNIEHYIWEKDMNNNTVWATTHYYYTNYRSISGDGQYFAGVEPEGYTVHFLGPPYIPEFPTLTIMNTHEGEVLYTHNVTINWTINESGVEYYVDYYDVYVDDEIWDKYLENSITVNIPDGYHSVEVEGINQSYDTAICDDLVNFTVDAEPPELEIREPYEGEVIWQSSVYVEWVHPTPQKSWDNIPIDHYNVRMDNGYWINVSLNTSYTFKNVADGEHTVYVKCYDIYGLNTTKMVNFTVDAQPPELKILTPKDNSFINKSAVTVKWWGYDGNGIDHYLIGIDYGPVDNYWLYLSNTTNFYVFTNLTEGSHTVYVECYEKSPPQPPERDYGPPPYSGRSTMKAVTFTVDITPPALTINPPTYLNLSAVQISWRGDDNIGISHYDARMDNSSWINVGLNTSYIFSGVYGRNHTVSVRAYDLANNVIEKEISLAPPSFNFSILNSTNGMVGWRNITLDIKEYRGMELKKMRIVVENSTGTTIDTNWLNYTNSYSFSLNSSGYYTITVFVKDKFGNEANTTHEIYVDLEPPVIKDIIINHSTTSNMTNVTLNAMDASGISQYGYAVNGMFIAWYNSSTFPIYLPYKSGNYSITLYVKDRFGHITTESTWVNVNLTANNAGTGGGGGGNKNTNPSKNPGLWDMLIGMLILLGAVILAVVWLVFKKKKPKEHGEKELTKKEKAILKELTEYVNENQGEPRGDVVKAVSTRMGVSEGEVATILDYGIENFIFEEREEEGVKRIYPLTEEEEQGEEPIEEENESINEDIPEGMVKCPACGALNPADAETCSVCGAPLHEEKKEEEKEEENKDEEAI